MIEISNDIKQQIVRFAFRDKDSAFYRDNWFDFVDGRSIYKELKSVLDRSDLPIIVGEYDRSYVNIDKNCKYIELEWPATHEIRGAIDIGILADLESDKEFNYLKIVDIDGGTESYLLDELVK